MKDLFGNEYDENQNLPKSRKIKDRYGYIAKSTNEQKCKNCNHLMRKEYHNKVYYKCENLGDSQGPATDIRLSGFCRLYKDR